MNRIAACALAVSMMCCLDTAGAQTTRSAPPQLPPVVEKPSPSLTPTLPSPSPSAPSSPAALGSADVDEDVLRRASDEEVLRKASALMRRPAAPFPSDPPAPAAAAPPTEGAPSYSDLCQATPRPPWCSR